MRMAIYRLSDKKWHRWDWEKKQIFCGHPYPKREDFKSEDYFSLGNVDYGAPKEPPREDFCKECFAYMGDKL